MVKTRVWGLLLGDVLVFYIALTLVLFLRYYSATNYGGLLREHLTPFSFIFILWVVAFYILGLYDIKKLKNSIEFLKLLVLGAIINLAIALAFFYLLPIFGIRPRANLLLFIGASTILVYLWRYLFNTFLGARVPRKLLLVGLSQESEVLINYLKKNPQLGYEVTYWLKEAAGGPEWLRLPQLISEYKITNIVVPTRLQKNSALAKALFENLALGIEVVSLPELYEEVFQKTPLDELEETWFLENLKKERTFYKVLKRPLEFMLTTFLVIILSPLMLLIALLVKLTSAGPIIYKQTRAGQLGESFTLYKFRTMKKDAELAGPKWATYNDPRLTPIGKVLRQTHLDELPQLFNILRGGLSFVGPRPERPEFIAELKQKIPFYEVRHLVKPGLTGWAQTNYRYGASEADALEKLQYDIFYIKNRSLMLDLLIILKTIRLLFVNPK